MTTCGGKREFKHFLRPHRRHHSSLYLLQLSQFSSDIIVPKRGYPLDSTCLLKNSKQVSKDNEKMRKQRENGCAAVLVV